MVKISFKEADIRRAVKGFQATGLDVGSVRIQPDGCIIIIPKGEVAPSPDNDLDKWIASNARSTQRAQ